MDVVDDDDDNGMVMTITWRYNINKYDADIGDDDDNDDIIMVMGYMMIVKYSNSPNHILP